MGNQVSCCFSKSRGLDVSSESFRNTGCHQIAVVANGVGGASSRATPTGAALNDDRNNGDPAAVHDLDAVTSYDMHLNSVTTKDIALLQAPNQSCGNLQHISEREPNDDTGDPSISPSTDTIFLSKFKYNPKVIPLNRNRRKSEYYSSKPLTDKTRNLSRKYSSCSTIFLDESTVSLPNLKYIVTAVSLAIYYNIKNRNKCDINNYTLDIFDEKLHPLSKEPVPEDYSNHDPDHRQIYRFIRMLFNSAQLTAECAIVTLVYLERLLTYTDIAILPANWKRVTLASILLSSKVWDDQAVWNVDYCQIMKDISVDDMNELERQFLEMLQFNINVPSSVYAKYYFDLRTLAHLSNVIVPMKPLYIDKAAKLEVMSTKFEEMLTKKRKTSLKRVWSLSKISNSGSRTKAIIS